MIFIDLETWSTVDISLGAYKYAEGAEILCLSIGENENEVYNWVNPKYRDIVPSDPQADDLILRLNNPDEVFVAHNVGFEYGVLWTKCRDTFGFDMRCQWRCTAQMARAAGLPYGLEDLAIELKLDVLKDKRGKSLIQLFCIPQRDGSRIYPDVMNADDFKAFVDYCNTDVVVEAKVYNRLKPFEPRGLLLEAFNWDLITNARGVPVNQGALKVAKGIVDSTKEKIGSIFEQKTGLRPSQGQAVKRYLNEKGLNIPDMRSATLDEYLTDDILVKKYPEEIDILDLYSQVATTAVSKIDKMLNCRCYDGTVKGTLLFYGANTGRWSGKLIQPQNFKKPTIKGAEGIYEMVCNKASAEDIELVYGYPVIAASNCIRNFIDAGRPMLQADYAAIECRILNWLVGQDEVVEIFRAGGDVYRVNASKIYNCKPEDIGKESKERQLGKQAELGCGYGMWIDKFIATCDKYGIEVDEATAKLVVTSYRQSHDKVVKGWEAIEKAAIKVIIDKDGTIQVGKIKVKYRIVSDIPYLLLELPSGRNLAYPNPDVVWRDRYGKDTQQITFYGMNSFTHQYGTNTTYGGKLIENVVQAIAADIMMNGAIKAYKAGYDIFMLVHDEALAIQKPGQTVEEFCDLLTDLPAWAEGLPLKAEGKIMPFYKK